MINVDATIFFQALHFFLAWWVLDKFLFRSVVKAVFEEQGVLDALSKSIVKEQELLQHERDLHAEDQRVAKIKFKQEAPLIEPESSAVYLTISCPVTANIEKKKKHALVKEAKELLLQRVLNG